MPSDSLDDGAEPVAELFERAVERRPVLKVDRSPKALAQVGGEPAPAPAQSASFQACR